MKKKFAAALMALSLGPICTAALTSDLEQADALYATRTETTGASEALALYEKAINADKSAVTAAWKAARACYWIGEHSEAKRDKLEYFQRGLRWATKATELDPKSVEAHFWVAGLNGSYGETKGILKSLMLLKPIRKELDTINRLNDRYQGGAGYRVLGIIDYKVPGLAGGSKKRAREQLNKALMIDPNNPFTQYYLAEFLFTAEADKKQALEHLDTLQKLSVSDDVDGPDLKMIQQKGERLRRQIGT